MAKGYWITCYRSVANEEVVVKYARVAGPAIEAHGGRFLVRGKPVKTYEAGLEERLVIIEFESVKAAMAAYQSPEYSVALAILNGFAERDIRIIEGA